MPRKSTPACSQTGHMMVRAVVLLCFIYVSATGHAQFSDMSIVGIKRIGHVDNGPVHSFSKKPWALIQLEITDMPANDINGSRIVPLGQKNIVLPDKDDKVYDAYAGAWEYNYAKEITLHHPDFNNCKINFEDYLDSPQLESGMAYRIQLKVPSAFLIEANTAYNNLDFRKAAKIYAGIVSDPKANGEEKIIASNHLTDIDSLISWSDSAQKYEALAQSQQGKARERSLYRSRIYYKKISSERGLVNAGLKYEDINKLLGINKESSDYSLNSLKKISAKKDAKSVRALGNDAVTYEYAEKKGTDIRKSALIIITVPVKEATVLSDRAVKPTFEKDNEIWLYLKTEIDKTDKNPVLFTVTHPDFTQFDFRLLDFDDQCSLEGGCVYRVSLDPPSLIMMMANKRLAALDLEDARTLFNYNYADGDEQQYADKCRGFLASAAVKQLITVLEDKTKQCRAIEKEYFSIITGLKKFDDTQSRNTALNKINRQLETEASVLEYYYRTIHNEANNRGLNLRYAEDMANEFSDIKNGVRRLPLIVEFTEMQEEKNFFSTSYGASERLTISPTVLIEIRNDNDNCIFRIKQKVKDGKINFILNTAGTSLFCKGLGKITISTPKNLNNGKKLYKDIKLDIGNFRITDYTTRKLNVTLVKN